MGDCRNRGFTLVELLVVLAVMTVMITVAVSTLAGGVGAKEQLRREARSLTRLFREARFAAMESRRRVDVYVDPATRRVFAVEAAYARRLLSANPQFFTDGVSAAELEPETNRFFRIAEFAEEFSIEPFPLAEIDSGESVASDPFEPVDPAATVAEPDAGHPVFGFTQAGCASGGGVSVSRGELRIDIACELLTGFPEIVRRRTAQ